MNIDLELHLFDNTNDNFDITNPSLLIAIKEIFGRDNVFWYLTAVGNNCAYFNRKAGEEVFFELQVFQQSEFLLYTFNKKGSNIVRGSARLDCISNIKSNYEIFFNTPYVVSRYRQ